MNGYDQILVDSNIYFSDTSYISNNYYPIYNRPYKDSDTIIYTRGLLITQVSFKKVKIGNRKFRIEEITKTLEQDSYFDTCYEFIDSSNCIYDCEFYRNGLLKKMKIINSTNHYLKPVNSSMTIFYHRKKRKGLKRYLNTLDIGIF